MFIKIKNAEQFEDFKEACIKHNLPLNQVTTSQIEHNISIGEPVRIGIVESTLEETLANYNNHIPLYKWIASLNKPLKSLCSFSINTFSSPLTKKQLYQICALCRTSLPKELRKSLLSGGIKNGVGYSNSKMYFNTNSDLPAEIRFESYQEWYNYFYEDSTPKKSDSPEINQCVNCSDWYRFTNQCGSFAQNGNVVTECSMAKKDLNMKGAIEPVTIASSNIKPNGFYWVRILDGKATIVSVENDKVRTFLGMEFNLDDVSQWISSSPLKI